MSYQHDVVVVGSGPNGLAAAITMQQQGLSVKLLEAKAEAGGGMRSAQLTQPGFVHDVCSAIHPLAKYSPFFKKLPLENFGLQWIQPELALAHPFDNGEAAILNQYIEETSASLGVDAEAYKKFISPLVNHWDDIGKDLLGPLSIPKHPLAFAQFGLHAFRSAAGLSNSVFRSSKAKGLFAGLAAHSIQPLEAHLTAAIGLVLLIVGHKEGWPFPKGGTQSLAKALTNYFISLGGVVETNTTVTSYKALDFAKIKVFDLTPRQLLSLDGLHFPSLYKKQLEHYRYGPGIFKIDYALHQPIPFKAQACTKAGTVHLGGTMEEIALSEREMWTGKHAHKPYALLAQQSVFDSTRAPSGKHTAWVYCHVPAGSTQDMSAQIEAQIERFAPGFKDIIIQKNVMNTLDVERYNANYIGGDITGGIADWRQLFTRPAIRISPYSTPLKDVYICSSSTPPGAGVHGMCGFHAARKVLKDHYDIDVSL